LQYVRLGPTGQNWAIGTYVPPRLLTNKDLSVVVDLSTSSNIFKYIIPNGQINGCWGFA
jgi:hypothetical protein